MQQVARWISIVGHPFVTATAMVLASGTRSSGSAAIASTGAAFVLIAVLPVAILMIRQVRRGAWEHVDASNRRERPMLYIVGIAAVLVWFGYLALTEPRSPLMRGLVVTMVMFLACGILTRWIKVSLHVTFAAYSATTLVFFGSPAGWVIAALVPLLIWSRLRLGRHKPLEVVLGVAIGVSAGLALHYPISIGDESVRRSADAPAVSKRSESNGLVRSDDAGEVQRIGGADRDDPALAGLAADLA